MHSIPVEEVILRANYMPYRREINTVQYKLVMENLSYAQMQNAYK